MVNYIRKSDKIWISLCVSCPSSERQVGSVKQRRTSCPTEPGHRCTGWRQNRLEHLNHYFYFGKGVDGQVLSQCKCSNPMPVTLRGPWLYRGALAAIAKLLPVWRDGKPLNLPRLDSPRPWTLRHRLSWSSFLVFVSFNKYNSIKHFD